jgi:hypothetical protein
MAIQVHVARVAFLQVNAVGTVVSKDAVDTPLSEHLSGSHEHRLLEDTNIPNTSGNPTVKTYLESEASDDYVLNYMDQNTIITYQRTAAGGFA